MALRDPMRGVYMERSRGGAHPSVGQNASIYDGPSRFRAGEMPPGNEETEGTAYDRTAATRRHDYDPGPIEYEPRAHRYQPCRPWEGSVGGAVPRSLPPSAVAFEPSRPQLIEPDIDDELTSWLMRRFVNDLPHVPEPAPVAVDHDAVPEGTLESSGERASENVDPITALEDPGFGPPTYDMSRMSDDLFARLMLSIHTPKETGRSDLEPPPASIDYLVPLEAPAGNPLELRATGLGAGCDELPRPIPHETSTPPASCLVDLLYDSDAEAELLMMRLTAHMGQGMTLRPYGPDL